MGEGNDIGWQRSGKTVMNMIGRTLDAGIGDGTPGDRCGRVRGRITPETTGGPCNKCGWEVKKGAGVAGDASGGLGFGRGSCDGLRGRNTDVLPGSRSCGWAMRTEAQVNPSRGLDGESEDWRRGRPRSIAQSFGMHRDGLRFGARACHGTGSLGRVAGRGYPGRDDTGTS